MNPPLPASLQVTNNPRGRFILFLILILVIIITALLISSGRLKLNQTSPPSFQTISPNILYLTQPIISFSGQITKISGNTITTSHQASASSQTSQITPSYQVTIAPTTSISFLSLDTSTNTSTPSATIAPTIKNLEVGQLVAAISRVDLRTLFVEKFESQLITMDTKTK